ncbi:MAG: hypothetical protein PUP93_33990 [Rhizonema sp. NSF051]|nr:hypothetical protein [Rhizonema sp. NSF051]
MLHRLLVKLAKLIVRNDRNRNWHIVFVWLPGGKEYSVPEWLEPSDILPHDGVGLRQDGAPIKTKVYYVLKDIYHEKSLGWTKKDTWRDARARIYVRLMQMGLEKFDVPDLKITC